MEGGAKMRGFLGLIVGILVSGLFVVALLYGGGRLSEDNNGQSILQDSSINKTFTTLNTDLNKAWDSANNTETATAKSPLTISQGSFIINAMGGLWVTVKVIPTLVWNTMLLFLQNSLFGSPAFAVVFGVIGAIVIFMFTLYAWKLISSGEPE